MLLVQVLKRTFTFQEMFVTLSPASRSNQEEMLERWFKFENEHEMLPWNLRFLSAAEPNPPYKIALQFHPLSCSSFSP